MVPYIVKKQNKHKNSKKINLFVCCQGLKPGEKIGMKDLQGNQKELNGLNAIVKEQLEDGTYKVDIDGDEEIIQDRNITDPYLDVNEKF